MMKSLHGIKVLHQWIGISLIYWGFHINSLPTNDGKCRHDLCELSISLWEFIWVFNTRRYTLVHGFCFFRLFLMVGKELSAMYSHHPWLNN